MQGLTGLTGLAQQQGQFNADPGATAEQRLGNTVDPRHTDLTKTSPYPWESTMTPGGSHGPYGPENQMLGDADWVWQPAGDMTEDPTFDRTPAQRAGPFPKGVASGPVPSQGPDDIANQLEQSMVIHGIKTGGGLKALYPIQGLGVQQDDWREIWQVEPGHSDLSTLPEQAKSSGFLWGTTDRTQSFARQNEHGFDSSHMHRRYATGSIPGNSYWMQPGGRPLMKTMAGPARPAIGPDSPFYGDDLGQAFGINGAYLQNVPTEYIPPPQPTLAASQAQTNDSGVVEWY